ncbi:MAG: UDP-N-acetylmuramoyl-tripeptide--D-alanyl-D-alanine ligase [Leptospirillia bacterium]
MRVYSTGDELLGALRGRWAGEPPREPLTWINAGTDSRKILPGEIFVALRGARTDGHDHLPEALVRGALLAIVEWATPSVKIPQIVVSDTTIALREMGALALSAHRRAGHRLIALTGSVGKTTTRELLRAGLPPGESHGSAGNENNEIGVPLTILSWPEDRRWCVLEAGVRKSGDMDYLAPLLASDTGIVTAIAPGHLENLGSVQEVWREKSKLLKEVVPGGVRILPAEVGAREKDEALFGDTSRRLKTVALGGNGSAGIRGRLVETPGGLVLKVEKPALAVPLPWPSAALGWCMLVALAALEEEGVELAAAAERLSSYRGFPGRMEKRTHSSGLLLLLDHYNANPASMAEALDWLGREAALRPVGRGFAVLGDMLELGEESGSFHEEAGRKAASLNLKTLWYRGEHLPDVLRGYLRGGGKEETVRPASEFDRDIREGRGPGGEDVVLVKGSRGMKLEEVVAPLLEGD